MSIQDELIKTIEIIVNRKINNIVQSRDVATVVTEINGDKYKVNIDGGDYWIKDGVNISPTIGMAVWVHVPNGKLGNAYVCAKR